MTVQIKTALITGGGSGIGYEFSRLLLQSGANVVIGDIQLRPEAQQLMLEYSQSTPRAIYHRVDVTDWEELENMFKIAVTHFGSIDIVAPCAGIFEPNWSSFWHPPGGNASLDDPSSGRYKTIDINLTHPIRLTQLAISHFLACTPSSHSPKSIIHTCSVASQGAGLMFPLYIATKHGLDGFVRSLGDLEASHGIRVAAVEPGAVKTPLFTENPDKMRIIDEEKDDWVYPKEVAKVMLAMVQGNNIEVRRIFDSSRILSTGNNDVEVHGGSVIEVLVGHIRDVPLFGNLGPMSSRAKGWKTSAGEDSYANILQELKHGWGEF